MAVAAGGESARIFFIGYYIMVVLVVLNVITAFLLDGKAAAACMGRLLRAWVGAWACLLYWWSFGTLVVIAATCALHVQFARYLFI